MGQAQRSPTFLLEQLLVVGQRCDCPTLQLSTDLLVFPAARRQRTTAASGILQPQARFGDKLANIAKRHAKRLLGQNPPRLDRRSTIAE